MGFPELGPVRISELESVRGALGLAVERDRHFAPVHTLSVYARAAWNAAVKLLRRLLNRQGYLPDTIVTDRLRSYGAALRDLALADRHVTGGRSNNRAEVSHQPSRHRERQRCGFRSPGSAQRFLATHAAIYNHFNVQRHLISRRTLRKFRAEAFARWREVVSA